MRKRPTSGYGAQFSLPFAVACGLVRRRFTLAELEPAAYNDPVLLALAAKVNYAVDPDTEYPRYFSGEVRVRTTDGRELRQREHINRGSAGRPLNGEDIAQKFNDNALLATTAAHAASIEEAILAIDTAPDLGALTTALRAPATSNQ